MAYIYNLILFFFFFAVSNFKILVSWTLTQMVRELITIQVGQCGNNIGNAFWNTAAKDHHLGKDSKFEGKIDDPEERKRLERIDVYYQEISPYKFIPRACLIDLEPNIIDNIKASPIGSTFKPDNICCGTQSAANNWFAKIYI